MAWLITGHGLRRKPGIIVTKASKRDEKDVKCIEKYVFIVSGAYHKPACVVAVHVGIA